jgi:hypothetical protein
MFCEGAMIVQDDDATKRETTVFEKIRDSKETSVAWLRGSKNRKQSN